MTHVLRATITDQLEPVRRALLEDARTEAEAITSRAVAQAHEVLAAAQRESDAAVEEACRRARATARARRTQARAAARRDAHTAVLVAEEDLRRQAARRIHAAVSGLPADPRYPALLDALAAAARARLGDDAEIVRDPPGGGVLGRSGPRTVDYRLDALADLAVDAVADDLLPDAAALDAAAEDAAAPDAAAPDAAAEVAR